MCRESFLSFYLTNTLSGLVTFFFPMTQEAHNVMLLPKHLGESAWCQILGDALEGDLLHHRGKLCVKAFLKRHATQTAALQYVIFIVVLNYTDHNVLVFPKFTKGAQFDFRQQALFVAIAWSLDFVIYEVTNIMCKRLFDLTPLYVGEALIAEHPRFGVSMLVIAAHIISDVYLSMMFGMEGGLYFTNPSEEGPPEEVFLPGDASAAGGLLGGS